MALDKETLSFGTRLVALEHLLAHMLALQTLHLTQDQFETMALNWDETMDRETFPGTTPEQSALLSGEMRDRILDLIDMTRSMRLHLLERAGRTGGM